MCALGENKMVEFKKEKSIFYAISMYQSCIIGCVITSLKLCSLFHFLCFCYAILQKKFVYIGQSTQNFKIY